jgi:hypothetical protein
MTELPQQNVPVASAVSAVERVQSVKPAATISQSATQAGDNATSVAYPSESTARTFADYARVNRDIANVVDSLGPPPAAVGVESAESAVLSLLPQPSVVLPLPPASQDTIAFVAQVVQSIQRQAALTRAAMSGVAPVVVDAATAA